MDFVTNLFNHYGYIVLFVALMLELIAFPTPGETLMAYCGFLVFQGRLNWGLSIFVAALGIISGITIAYFISLSLGTAFFQKYGPYLHISPDKIDKTSQWFERYGNGLLIVAYFIPGVRHVTGYFSGITRISYRRFALNAYIGAFIWAATFISLGKVLGSNWERLHGSIKNYLIIGGIILAVFLLGFYFYRKYKVTIMGYVVKSLENGLQVFHSLGKIKVVIIGMAAVFITLFIVLMGLIQDFLANEFSEFDAITALLVRLIFSEQWSSIMGHLRLLTTPESLAILTLLGLLWIIIKGSNHLLEMRFLFIVVLGGALLEKGLRFVFHRAGPLSGGGYTFPSQQTFLAVVVYGFVLYMVYRYAKTRWLGTLSALMLLGVCLATGLSVIFFQVQYPSDTAAGYVFGGVWLSLNIILMEVFRVLPDIQDEKR